VFSQFPLKETVTFRALKIVASSKLGASAAHSLSTLLSQIPGEGSIDVTPSTLSEPSEEPNPSNLLLDDFENSRKVNLLSFPSIGEPKAYVSRESGKLIIRKVSEGKPTFSSKLTSSSKCFDLSKYKSFQFSVEGPKDGSFWVALDVSSTGDCGSKQNRLRIRLKYELIDSGSPAVVNIPISRFGDFSKLSAVESYSFRQFNGNGVYKFDNVQLVGVN
jgi:hypothetical protein